jgi:hypothetical protein
MTKGKYIAYDKMLAVCYAPKATHRARKVKLICQMICPTTKLGERIAEICFLNLPSGSKRQTAGISSEM